MIGMIIFFTKLSYFLEDFKLDQFMSEAGIAWSTVHYEKFKESPSGTA